MTCNNCASHIKEALDKVVGIDNLIAVANKSGVSTNKRGNLE